MAHQQTTTYWGTGFRVELRGFPLRPDGKKVPDVHYGKLHRLIAWHVLMKSGPLTGDEVYFLRAHIDWSRSEGARNLKVTRRTLINWEDQEGKPIRGSALVDLAIRELFASHLFPGQWLDARRTMASIGGKPGRIQVSYGDYRRFVAAQEANPGAGANVRAAS